MNFNLKNTLLGTTIVLPAVMGLSISNVNANTIQSLIINSTVNFRVSANINSTKIDTLRKGQKVKYLGISGNWYKIEYNGKTGYIYKTYASATSVAESSNNSKKYVNCTALNLRSGAGTSYSVKKVLYKGTNVTVLSTSGEWTKIEVNGTTGYVASKYLSSSSTASENIKNPTTTEKDTTSTTRSEKISKIINIAKSKIGCKYVRGSEGSNTFDCTGLTYYLYKQINVTIPRGTAQQKSVGSYVSKSNLQPGDLVFLDTKGDDGVIDHASIYIGNNTIIHANSAAGKVGTSDLNTAYYKKAYVSARRVLD